jgi:hypothetical protein
VSASPPCSSSVGGSTGTVTGSDVSRVESRDGDACLGDDDDDLDDAGSVGSGVSDLSDY